MKAVLSQVPKRRNPNEAWESAVQENRRHLNSADQPNAKRHRSAERHFSVDEFRQYQPVSVLERMLQERQAKQRVRT